jgi:hypothetical protein
VRTFTSPAQRVVSRKIHILSGGVHLLEGALGTIEVPVPDHHRGDTDIVDVRPRGGS